MSRSVIPEDYMAPRSHLPQLLKSLPELTYPKRLNLAEELLDANLVEHADKIAIYGDTENLSYENLNQELHANARASRGRGNLAKLLHGGSTWAIQ